MGNPEADNQNAQKPAVPTPETGGGPPLRPHNLPARGQDTDLATRPEMRAPALRWRRAFPGDDAQISALRRWLECLLPPCPSRDDLVSVAVELGTNAIRHTASGSRGQFVVEVIWSLRMTRVAVYDDGSPDSPQVTQDLLCEDGRGLLTASTLSVRMGVGGNAKGRVVWADIPWAGRDVPSQPVPVGFGRARAPHRASATRRQAAGQA